MHTHICVPCPALPCPALVAAVLCCAQVSEFLGKGVGAAQLPRKGRDRVDKEKEKREKGQSTHASWKSEAEMVLRQQYD